MLPQTQNTLASKRFGATPALQVRPVSSYTFFLSSSATLQKHNKREKGHPQTKASRLLKGSETKLSREKKTRKINIQTNILLHQLCLFLGRHLLYPGTPHPNLPPKSWDHTCRKLRSRGELRGQQIKMTGASMNQSHFKATIPDLFWLAHYNGYIF